MANFVNFFAGIKPPELEAPPEPSSTSKSKTGEPLAWGSRGVERRYTGMQPRHEWFVPDCVPDYEPRNQEDKWTREEDEIILEMRRARKSYGQIAERLPGRSPSATAAHATRLGCRGRVKDAYDHAPHIIDLHKQGHTPSEIENITGYSPGTISGVIFRWRKMRSIQDGSDKYKKIQES